MSLVNTPCPVECMYAVSVSLMLTGITYIYAEQPTSTTQHKSFWMYEIYDTICSREAETEFISIIHVI